MQGKGPTVQPALNRMPRSEDLQKLLKAVQTVGVVVQQPISLDSGKRFVLKVQPARGSSGMGRSKTTLSSPLWSLCEGVNTLWEYNTADIELIFNLVEEAVYAARTSAPAGDKTDAAMSVLEEMAAAHGIANIAFQGNTKSEAQPAQPVGYQAAEHSGYQTPAQGGYQTPAQGGYQDAAPGGYQASDQGGYQAAPTSSYAAMESAQFSSETSGQFGSRPQAQEQPGPAPAPDQAGGMEMSGNLSEQGVCQLFQSISVGKLTGRLDVTSGLESLEVYFEEGAPRRASYRSDSMTGAPRDITGEEVLLEGMTWKNGFFQFNPSLKSSERSPMRRLDLLLLEGAALKDYFDALDKAGLTPESAPVRTNTLSEAEFEKALSAGIPVNMERQKAIYVAFNGQTTLMDIVRETNLPKSVWLPLVFNLLDCGLIGLSVNPQSQIDQSSPPQSPMLKEAAKEAFQELLRPDTMLLSYALFMHFLEVEFQRALRLRLPFSLIIISVHKEGAGIKEQLSSDDLKLVAEKVGAYLEPYDHLGHYQTLDVGILLPHRPSAQAREYTKKIIDDFNRELAQSSNGVRFVWSVGISCVPEDGIKLGAMVAKAEKERNMAQVEKQPMA
jgi:GGDEF domain-containing protein